MPWHSRSQTCWLLERYLYTVDKWKTLLEYFVFCTKKKNLNSTNLFLNIFASREHACFACICFHPCGWISNHLRWQEIWPLGGQQCKWLEIWPPGGKSDHLKLSKKNLKSKTWGAWPCYIITLGYNVWVIWNHHMVEIRVSQGHNIVCKWGKFILLWGGGGISYHKNRPKYSKSLFPETVIE